MARKPKIGLAICQNCGKEFEYRDYGNNQLPKYCGTECRKITYIDRNKKVKQENSKFIGKKINEWTILDIFYKNGNGWAKAKCSCGECRDVLLSNILQEKSKSCGHRKYGEGARAIDETGNRYGKLTVIKKVPFEDLTEVQKNSKNIYWECKCDCGSIITVSGSRLRFGAVKSCGCLASSGEEKIAKILKEHKMKFKREVSFKDLKETLPLRFDFMVILPDNSFYFIEFDGIQHFEPRSFGGDALENFKKVKISDKKKEDYCKENDIPLIRIPYTRLPTLTIDDLLLP